jgi:hypothetical protein
MRQITVRTPLEKELVKKTMLLKTVGIGSMIAFSCHTERRNTKMR